MSDAVSSTSRRFRIALTGDFYDLAGQPKYREMGLPVLDEAKHFVEYFSFAEHRPELAPEQLGSANGVIVLTPAVTARSVSQSDQLLAVGRFGVGYDAVDVNACTAAADVVVFITAGAVDHSVAEATVAWMLALTHHTRVEDRLVREAKWHDRSQFMGRELRNRAFGAIGFGGIARATVRMLAGFAMRPPLAFDPFLDESTAARFGVRQVELAELLAEADFVSIHCPLNATTRGIIGRRELALMKPEAYLINTARGGIVDEQALGEALSAGRIAGAALDCFATEPLTEPHALSHLDNVLFAPHSIAWTHEIFRDIGRSVCQGMVDLALGKRPHGVVNPEVFDRPGFQQKWACLRISC